MMGQPANVQSWAMVKDAWRMKNSAIVKWITNEAIDEIVYTHNEANEQDGEQYARHVVGCIVGGGVLNRTVTEADATCSYILEPNTNLPNFAYLIVSMNVYLLSVCSLFIHMLIELNNYLLSSFSSFLETVVYSIIRYFRY